MTIFSDFEQFHGGALVVVKNEKILMKTFLGDILYTYKRMRETFCVRAPWCAALLN